VETINVHDAKTHLSQLLARVEAGEVVSIGRGGRHSAYLSAEPPRATPAQVAARFGFMRGLGSPTPADFNTLQAQEIERQFYGQ